MTSRSSEGVKRQNKINLKGAWLKWQDKSRPFDCNLYSTYGPTTKRIEVSIGSYELKEEVFKKWHERQRQCMEEGNLYFSEWQL
ncbi:hypothetical protein CE91St42_05810 [Oscillospiraceae bacterium]|nr:hypothetical protein CE91St42_05810 [Oscillospiraceae bacterium]